MIFAYQEALFQRTFCAWGSLSKRCQADSNDTNPEGSHSF